MPELTIIKPQHGWLGINFHELWKYRELLGFLIWRDITVRYKQTLMGALWAIIQPFFTMIVLSVVFGKIARVPTDGLPYPIFSYSALVVWTYFAGALRRSTESLIMNTNLVTKIYFPRLIMPVSSTLSGLIDFAISFLVLIGMFFYYGITIHLTIFYLPFFLLLACALAFGTGTWLCAMNVKFRDIRYAVPFLAQIWMFASPVAYSSSSVPEKWKFIYGLNPMAGIVQGFRWSLLGKGQPSGLMLGVSVAVTAVILVSGVFYFRRMEKEFADVI